MHIKQGYTQQAMFILLPIITADLNISASRGGWLTAAYALGFSSAFLLMGRLGDVYGHRRVFLAACVWMLAIMVINPFLTNQWAFFIARGFHGMVSCFHRNCTTSGMPSLEENKNNIRRTNRFPLILNVREQGPCRTISSAYATRYLHRAAGGSTPSCLVVSLLGQNFRKSPTTQGLSSHTMYMC